MGSNLSEPDIRSLRRRGAGYTESVAIWYEKHSSLHSPKSIFLNPQLTTSGQRAHRSRVEPHFRGLVRENAQGPRAFSDPSLVAGHKVPDDKPTSQD